MDNHHCNKNGMTVVYHCNGKKTFIEGIFLLQQNQITHIKNYWINKYFLYLEFLIFRPQLPQCYGIATMYHPSHTGQVQGQPRLLRKNLSQKMNLKSTNEIFHFPRSWVVTIQIRTLSTEFLIPRIKTCLLCFLQQAMLSHSVILFHKWQDTKHLSSTCLWITHIDHSLGTM